MELTSYEWLLVICIILGLCSFYVVQYIANKNAERHPLDDMREQLGVQPYLDHDSLEKEKKVSCWLSLFFACLFLGLSLLWFLDINRYSTNWLLPVLFGAAGIRFMFDFVKDVRLFIKKEK